MVFSLYVGRFLCIFVLFDRCYDVLVFIYESVTAVNITCRICVKTITFLKKKCQKVCCLADNVYLCNR